MKTTQSPNPIATFAVQGKRRLQRLGRTALVCAAFLAAGTFAVQADTAVTNGDFETGASAPWASGMGQNIPAPIAGAAHRGQYGLEVTGLGPPALISQNIQNKIIAGAVYHFTAWINVLEINSTPNLPAIYVPHLRVYTSANPGDFTVQANATNATGLGWQKMEVSKSFTAQELQSAVTLEVGGMGKFYIDDVSAELLANWSFDTADGAGWSYNPSGIWAPFAVPGEADLHRSYTGSPARMLWQDLDISNVGGAKGSASMRVKSTSSWPVAGTISTMVYLDYLDNSGNPQRALLLNPDNSIVGAPPEGTLFSTNFTLPANAQKVTGFSVDRNGPGLFQAMDFHLNLVAAAAVAAPTVTITSPAEGAAFAGGATIPLVAEVDNSGGATVTGVEFYGDGTLIGQARLSPLGEWNFPGGSRLSVMGNGLLGMVDYVPPQISGEPMYLMDGGFPTPNSFQGTFAHWNVPLGDPIRGNAGILFSFQTNGTLDASITGDVPLGTRSLVGGINESFPQYTLSWSGAAAGPHSVTARVYYGAGSSVTSAPVGITVSPTSSPYLTWQASKFTPTEIAAGSAAMGVDFEGDGMANILEYAFHTNPKAADLTGIGQGISGGRMQISFTCLTGRSDLTYTVQASSALTAGAWTDIAKSVGGAITVPLGSPALSTVSDTGIDARTVTVTEAAALAGKGFLRVKVTSP